MENNFWGCIFFDYVVIGNSDGEIVLMRLKYIGGYWILLEGSWFKYC